MSPPSGGCYHKESVGYKFGNVGAGKSLEVERLEHAKDHETERGALTLRERELSIDNLLVRIHSVMEIIFVDRCCTIGV